MTRGIIVAAALLAAAPAFGQNAVSGGFAFSYLDRDKGGSTYQPSSQLAVATGSNLVTAGGTAGPGTANSIKTQSRAWVNKLEITSTATEGFVFGSGSSVSAVNQRVTGAGNSPVTVNYLIGVDGSFTPGPASQYLPPQFAPPQNVTFYFLAYSGTALGLTKQTDQYGDYLYFESTVGHNTLSRGAGQAGHSMTLPAPIAAATLCYGTDTRCTNGGSFNDVLSLSFDVLPGQDYFIVSYLASQTSGQTLFFNTARLLSVQLAPEFDLVSGDSGVMKRAADGTFRPSIPEPATWAMLIGGFGLVGGVQRRRRLLRA